MLLHVADLLLVGPLDVVERHLLARSELIGARAARDETVHRPRFGEGAADQLPRRRPAEPAAALRGVHRLGHAQPE